MNKSITIPTITRDGSLLSRLAPIVLVGVDNVLDKDSRLYLRLLCRLVDKAFDEYLTAKEYLEYEIRTQDKFGHRFNIIGHLENCINAVSRATKVANGLVDGVWDGKKYIKKNYVLENLLSKESKGKIKKCNVSGVRNRVEHINEDIHFDKFNNNLSLDVDDDYTKICINNKCLLLSELATIIEDYHNIILEIYNGLPRGKQNGEYFYDDK